MNPPAKKIKVLHLITLSVVGGSQDNTFSTAELHDRSRYEVHVACNPDGHWAARARAAGEVFHSLPTLVTPIRPLADLQAFRDLLRLLRREQFDVVHTHTAKAGFLGRLAAWLARVPVVVHTYHAFPFHQFMPRAKRWLFIALERLVRPLTDFFITVSENERVEGFVRGVLDADNSRTIYSGIDFAKLDQATNRAEARAKLGVPDGWQLVLMAGRLDPQKAPQILIEAFARVVQAQPQTLLLIAGDGELRDAVEAQIDSLRLRAHVRILGFRNDVPELMQSADVFALSSLWEGMGRAMVEAMLVGKAVIVPAVNGIPEVVRHEETGLLFDAGNAAQLAGGLIDLLERPDKRQRLGENARQLTRQLFAVTTMVEGIEDVYARLLKLPPAARTRAELEKAA